MNKPNRTVKLLLVTIATLIVAILVSIGSGNGKSDTDGLGTVDNAAFNSTPSNPLNADAADTATTPKVRGGGPIHSWADLDARYGNDSSYKQCAENTLDISWDDDVPRIKQIEKKRTDGVSFVLAVNVDKNMSNTEIVEFARKHERPGLRKDTPVVRVDYFINTMDDTCTEFVDKRSLIRVAQAVPTNQVDEPLRTDKVMGIFDGCKNPWKLPEGVKPSGSPAPSPSPSDSKSPSPSPSGSTPGPSDTPTPSKSPSEDPANNGNAGDGGGRNEDDGPGEYIPPKDMEQPPDKPRKNPATPTPNKPAPPKVTPTTGGNQTVAPSQQPINDGNVDPNPESGQPCNPEFQNC